MLFSFFFFSQFEVNCTTFANPNWHMNAAFMCGQLEKKLWISFCFITILVVPINLQSLKLYHNMFCGWQMNYSLNANSPYTSWSLLWVPPHTCINYLSNMTNQSSKISYDKHRCELSSFSVPKGKWVMWLWYHHLYLSKILG